MLLPLPCLLMNSMDYLSKHMYSLWWKMAWSLHHVDPKYALFLFRLYPLINEVPDSFWRGWRTICMGDLKKKYYNRWKEASRQEFKSFLLYFFFNLETEGRHPKTASAWGRNRNFVVTLLQVSLEGDAGCDLRHVLWKSSRLQIVIGFLFASSYSDWKSPANPKKSSCLKMVVFN